MLLIVRSLLTLIEQNPLFFVGAVIVGIIPRKVRVCKKSSKRKGWAIELEACLWHFKWTEQEWHLRIIGVRLLNQSRGME